MVYGDPNFRKVEFLLRARLGDTAVIADVGRELSALPKPDGRNFPAATLYFELAQIEAIAGAGGKDLEWIAGLPPLERYVALNGAAQGYVERMTGIPAESRRYEYYQSGFR